MNYRRLKIASALAVALMTAGCQAGGTGAARPAHPNRVSIDTTGSDTLDWLREQLRRLRESDAASGFTPDDWEHQGLSPLVGMDRRRIVSALGNPDVCPADDGEPCQLLGRADMVYALFRLPEGSLGGGPHLVLTFDWRGTCSSARWVGTK